MSQTVPRNQALRWALRVAALLGLLALVAVLSWYFATVDLDRLAEYITHTAQEFRFWGYAAVFLITAISSASIFFPIPGLIVVVAVAKALGDRLGIALAASVGGALGETTAYLVGYLGRAAIPEKQMRRYHRAERWMHRYGSVAVFLFALVPFLPFDLVGIAAGSMRFPIWKFLVACWLGRLIRSLIEVYVGVSLWGAVFG